MTLGGGKKGAFNNYSEIPTSQLFPLSPPPPRYLLLLLFLLLLLLLFLLLNLIASLLSFFSFVADKRGGTFLFSLSPSLSFSLIPPFLLLVSVICHPYLLSNERLLRFQVEKREKERKRGNGFDVPQERGEEGGSNGNHSFPHPPLPPLERKKLYCPTNIGNLSNTCEVLLQYFEAKLLLCCYSQLFLIPTLAFLPYHGEGREG